MYALQTVSNAADEWARGLITIVLIHSVAVNSGNQCSTGMLSCVTSFLWCPIVHVHVQFPEDEARGMISEMIYINKKGKRAAPTISEVVKFSCSQLNCGNCLPGKRPDKSVPVTFLVFIGTYQ